MRSYGQYCAVAKTLDVIGDRWNLLIVRELLLRGACRYTDLLHGLPGISTNLLADRLRDLEDAGVVEREDAPPPIATTLFRLTSRGEELKTVLVELGRWGVPLMAEPSEGEEFRSHWLGVLGELYPADQAPAGPPVTIELRAGDVPIVIDTVDGAVRTRLGSAEAPDLVLAGAPQLMLGVLTGRFDLAEAGRRGLTWDGDPESLRRLRPEPLPAS